MEISLNITSEWTAKDILNLKSRFREIAEELDTLVTTVAPNGNTAARKGVVALYDNSGTYEMWVNTDGSTAWQKLASFSDVPTDYVDLTTAQSVGGVKTFTSIPVLPASDPTTDNQASRKLYTDTKIAKPGSDVQGDILYHNGSAYTRLAAGTNGQFLKTQGAGANPVWATNSPAMTLADSDTANSNNPTLQVTVDTSKQYLVYFDWTGGTDSGNPPNANPDYITFNSSSSARYMYYHLKKIAGTTASNNGSATNLALPGGAGGPGSGMFHLSFTTVFVSTTMYVAHVTGNYTTTETSSSPFAWQAGGDWVEFGGAYGNNGSDITTMEIKFTNGGSESVRANVYLYELSKT